MIKTLFVLAFTFSLVLTKQAFAQRFSVDSDISVINKKEPVKLQSFKVAQLSYDVADNNLLTLLKSDQNASLISVGKTVNLKTFEKEKSRIFLLLSPKSFEIKLKDIVFNVDTTLQKGFCTIKTVVKSEG